MANNYKVEVRVSGDRFDIENVSLKEIGDFLVALEQIIAPIVIRDNPERAFQEDDVIISLVSVSKGSLINVLETKYEREVDGALQLTVDAVISENFNALPQKSIDAMKSLVKFNADHSSSTEIWRSNGVYEKLATITQQTRVRADSFIVKGRTTLYGKLMRIGGDNPPRALLQFFDNLKTNTLSCRVSTTSLAQSMAHLLYERIGVKGVAHWDTRDMSLHEFRIEELTPYRQRSIKQAFNNLRIVAGKYYNPETTISIDDIRGTDESE